MDPAIRYVIRYHKVRYVTTLQAKIYNSCRAGVCHKYTELDKQIRL